MAPNVPLSEGRVAIQFQICNLQYPKRTATIEFPSHVSDPYLVVPPDVVEDLGIQQEERRAFYLPDGTETSRGLGRAGFSWDRTDWARIEIIFGEDRDFPRSQRGPLALKGICPDCGPVRVIPLLIGLPTHEAIEAAERGELALGGCVAYPDMPRFICSQCHSAIPELGTQ